MKRFTAIILLTVIILLNLTNIYAKEDGEYLTRVRAVEELVKTLYLSGGESSFLFENDYCLHPVGGGYVHFVPDENLLKNGYPVLCEIYKTVNGCEFSDISDENGTLSVYITLGKAMGIINGYDDNTFRPDRFITYNEAIKMIVCAFDIGGLADVNGGYPDGYIKAAKNEDIIKDNKINGGDMVNGEEFYKLIKAALNVTKNRNIQYLMGMFAPPSTPEECVRLYASAVMERNGAVQFALYDDELKESTRDGFISFHWVTGVSSPWVSGFDIVKISDLQFEVIYHYATSTGPGEDTSVKLSLTQINGGYRITGLY